MVRYGAPGAPPLGMSCLRTDKPIEAGTSGSPIIDRKGRLVGIVSRSSETDP
jgi:hypothetical protein